jgi:alpha-glucoside transport system substrate-binding protein
MNGRNRFRTAAVAAGTALLVTGCLSEGGGDDGGGGGDGAVEIIGAIGATNAEGLQAEVERIAEETGIDVTYNTLPDFDTVIQSRVRGNNAPDIALFPQPGVLFDLAAGGDVQALDDLVDVDSIAENLIPGVGEVGVSPDDGNTYGIPVSINVKSVVWTPLSFTDQYEVPATHQDLVALSDEIAGSGTPPWCFAFEAQQATGWYVTDWIEEYVLRIGGPEFYDQWVRHEVPFNDPTVVEAAEAFEELVLTDGHAVLDRPAMAATRWEDAMQPLVAEPPGCYMARQGNFIIGFWPTEVQQAAQDFVDTFLLPPYEGGFDGQPVLGGGDLAAAFNDDENTQTVLEALYTSDFGAVWAGSEGSEFLSPYPDFDGSAYSNEVTAEIATLITEADAFRFDGSDQMPGQVGSGTFWTEMTAWVAGQTDLETALQNIEDSWPE